MQKILMVTADSDWGNISCAPIKTKWTLQNVLVARLNIFLALLIKLFDTNFHVVYFSIFAIWNCKHSKFIEEVVALKSKLNEKLLKLWQFFTFEFFYRIIKMFLFSNTKFISLCNFRFHFCKIFWCFSQAIFIFKQASNMFLPSKMF